MISHIPTALALPSYTLQRTLPFHAPSRVIAVTCCATARALALICFAAARAQALSCFAPARAMTLKCHVLTLALTKELSLTQLPTDYDFLVIE